MNYEDRTFSVLFAIEKNKNLPKNNLQEYRSKLIGVVAFKNFFLSACHIEFKPSINSYTISTTATFVSLSESYYNAISYSNTP